MNTGGRTDVLRQVVMAGHTGDVDLLRGHVDAAEPQVREVVLGALARAGDLGADDLTRGLRDPAETVRRRAAELAANMPGDQPPSLLPALDDAADTVVEMAAWASGERSPAETGVVARLAALAVDHHDSLCREAAVAALGALADEGGRAAVLAATRDRPAVRRRAVLALAVFDGHDVDEALERARQDRDWQVRQAAEDVAG